MLRTAILMSLTLAVLAGLTPGEAVSGPPEGTLGKMVLDEVADGLRKYRKERDEAKRVEWLKRLAPTGDPRAAIALGEFLSGGSHMYDDLLTVGVSMARYLLPPPVDGEPLKQAQEAYIWWKKNEADLRRRAAQLPR